MELPQIHLDIFDSCSPLSRSFPFLFFPFNMCIGKTQNGFLESKFIIPLLEQDPKWQSVVLGTIQVPTIVHKMNGRPFFVVHCIVYFRIMLDFKHMKELVNCSHRKKHMVEYLHIRKTCWIEYQLTKFENVAKFYHLFFIPKVGNLGIGEKGL